MTKSEDIQKDQSPDCTSDTLINQDAIGVEKDVEQSYRFREDDSHFCQLLVLTYYLCQSKIKS